MQHLVSLQLQHTNRASVHRINHHPPSAPSWTSDLICHQPRAVPECTRFLCLVQAGRRHLATAAATLACLVDLGLRKRTSKSMSGAHDSHLPRDDGRTRSPLVAHSCTCVHTLDGTTPREVAGHDCVHDALDPGRHAERQRPLEPAAILDPGVPCPFSRYFAICAGQQ